MTTPPSALRRTLGDNTLADASGALRVANLAFAARYPGESAGRQPVHTVYGGAHLFRSDTATKLGTLALGAFTDYVPTPAELGEALGIPEHPALETIHSRVREKLGREPVEDFRIDFEDGYGNRSDAEEDQHAMSAAAELVRGASNGTLPPFIGIRIKPLTEELRQRSIRTLDIVVTALAEAGSIPNAWVITVPKVTIVDQVEYFVEALNRLEQSLGLTSGTLQFEVMVETPQMILDATGQSMLPRLLDVDEGRLTGAHFGTFDYTAACNITAAYQSVRHPASEFAKNCMQVAFAGTGVWLSDGPTTVLPIPVHRPSNGAPALTDVQRGENEASMTAAWRLHFDNVRHSLAGGFYQGWDLHPAQLVSRYAAVYSFFLDGIDAAGVRLRNFVDKAAQATLVGSVFDDEATAHGLLNFFLRGINSGAITEAEALAMTGLAADEFRQRSFAKILEARR